MRVRKFATSYRSGTRGLVAILGVAILLLSACKGTEAPTPTVTRATPVATATTAATPAATATRAPTTPAASTATAAPVPSATATKAVTPTPAVTAALTPVAGAPRMGGVFRPVAWTNPTGIIAPHSVSGSSRLPFVGPVHNQLLTWAYGKPGFPQIAPDLAESWTASADGLSYTFKLQKGVKFHNKAPANGREFKASDVVYSINHEMQRGTGIVRPFGDQIAMIDSVTALDDYTVQVKLKYVDSGFLGSLANPWRFMVPQGLFEAKGEKFTNPADLVGTGPFVITEFVSAVKGTFERNPEYFRKGLPYLDKIEAPIIEDTTAQFAALMVGRVDLTGLNFEGGKWKQATADPNITGAISPGISTRMLYLNNDIPAFKDARVRRAVQLAIDAKAILEVAEDGPYGDVLAGPLSPAFGDWALPPSELPKQDIAQAKALLKEAGVTNLKLKQIAGSSGRAPDTGALIQSELAQVGITTEIKLFDTAGQTAMLSSRDYGIFWASLGAPSENPVDFLRIQFHSKGGRNADIGWSSAEYDAMVDRIPKELDDAKRRQLVLEAQRFTAREVPLAWGYAPSQNRAWNKRVQNYFPAFTWGYDAREWQNVWIKA